MGYNINIAALKITPNIIPSINCGNNIALINYNPTPGQIDKEINKSWLLSVAYTHLTWPDFEKNTVQNNVYLNPYNRNKMIYIYILLLR
jgi:hypothetical protein